MAQYTVEQLTTIVNNIRNDTNLYSLWSDWDRECRKKSTHVKFDAQLAGKQARYLQKIQFILSEYERFAADVPMDYNFKEDAVIRKLQTMAKSYLIVGKEIEGRSLGEFERTPIGTDYYIDFTNGSDSAPHTGLMYGNYTMDAGSGETSLVETGGLDGRTTDDDWNGAYIYNVTRSAGATITDSAYVGGTWTLTHGTISGQTSGDTYYIIDAFATTDRFTDEVSQSEGDKAYIRANMTETVSADVIFDLDGGYDDYIYLIGCDSTSNDPWHDGSDVRPIIDFNDNSGVDFYPYTDNFWCFDNIEFRQNNSSGSLNFQYSAGHLVRNCKFYDDQTGGIHLGQRTGNTRIVDCVFDGNSVALFGINFENTYGLAVKGSTFDGYTSGALSMNHGGTLIGIDLEFGNTTSNTYDINMSSNGGCGWVWLRNCKSDSWSYSQIPATYGNGAMIFHEDYDQTKGGHRIITYAGNLTKETTVVQSGIESSVKFEPDSVRCGLISPLTLFGNTWDNWLDSWKVKLSADVERTITVYIRAYGYSSWPSASEVYLEASYLDESSGGHRATAVSTATLSDNTTWEAFSVTITPAQDGLVYLNVFHCEYTASCGIYVSVRPPVVT